MYVQCVPYMACLYRVYPPHAVYGVDLTTLVKLEGGLVPKILAQCIEELESRGLTSRGVYRVSGHSIEILELKDKFDQGVCVCVVSSTLLLADHLPVLYWLIISLYCTVLADHLPVLYWLIISLYCTG